MGKLAGDSIQPSVRAKAYRSLLEGRMTWVAGFKWVWTDKRWGKGRVDPVVGERSIVISEDVQTVLRKALVDRSPLVRRVAADQLILRRETMGADAIELAKALATDASPYIAERGCWVLSNTTGIAS
jgi:hypothetical protein